MNTTLLLFGMIWTAPAAFAAAPAKPAAVKPAPAATPAPARAAAVPTGDVNAMKRALASTSTKAPGDPARLDPNAALEVRGQSRTLSMMLVLKNGKEAINFIKVRRDYRPEITTTPY